MIHNETLYCDKKEEWRGDYSCLKVRLHFTRDKGFYYTTVFAPGFFLTFFGLLPQFFGFLLNLLFWSTSPGTRDSIAPQSLHQVSGCFIWSFCFFRPGACHVYHVYYWSDVFALSSFFKSLVFFRFGTCHVLLLHFLDRVWCDSSSVKGTKPESWIHNSHIYVCSTLSSYQNPVLNVVFLRVMLGVTTMLNFFTTSNK